MAVPVQSPAADCFCDHVTGGPIAIVGIGCRFPGAPGVDEFWELMRSGGDAVTEIPADRFDAEAFYDPRAGVAGKTRCRWGGVLPGIGDFDAAFFGISPREAVGLDPQARLLLEAGWEAVEDAGEVAGRLAGTATGVFVGENNSDYADLVMASDPARIDSVYLIAGGARSLSSGYLSYALDLRGPSVTLDAACSSSLLAVHLACQSIWRGESVMAFAGGASLVLLPHPSIGFSQAGMAAADGRCKAFAATGDGFVRSDGVGVVLLKPLARARADGNPVYAVILGSGASNDGQSSGLLMTPGQAGQELALRAAYAQAGVDPALVGYVEAHGTGTVAGDPVEVAALAAVLGTGRDPARPCLIGSVKSNIGHTEAAAGIAGLIKAALCLRHRLIPASLHTGELNPAIEWDSSPFRVAAELTCWPPGPRDLAGVSSFGISGTNVHVVLEAAPAPDGPGRAAPTVAGPLRSMLLPVSARSPQALADLADAYARFLIGPGGEPGTRFADVCYTAGVRRTHHEHRLAVVASCAADAALQLAALGAGAVPGAATAKAASRPKVVFVFPGQGGQWPGMGQQLRSEEPAFDAAVQRCAAAMAPYLDWSLTDLIAAGPEDPGWKQIDRIQPALFAVQVALAGLWQSWGVRPDAVVGHSMGETSAAYVAGALSLDDAARIICRRSALMRRLSGQGAMAVVGLAADEVRAELVGYAGLVSVAACNSPGATVVSGAAEAVDRLLAGLEGRGVYCRKVRVDVAAHSPQLDVLREDLLSELAGVTSRPGPLPIYSTVTGELIDGPGLDASYWVRNLRDPVLFAAAVERAAGDGHEVFVEVGPDPVLAGAVTETCRDRWPGTAVLASMRRDCDERVTALEALAELYRLGVPVAWDQLYPDGARYVALPRYPWQRQRIWGEFADRWKTGHAGDGAVAPRRGPDGRLAHPLLARRLRSAARPELHVFQTALGPQQMSFLADHQVQGSVVFPAAGYVEMALAAAGEVLGSGAELSELAFSRILVLPAGQLPALRLELMTEGTDRASFSIFSLTSGREDEDAVQHASGMLRLTSRDPATDQAATLPGGPGQQLRESGEAVAAGTHYDALRQAGLSYGPAFQGVRQIWRADGQALGRIEQPAPLAAEAGRYLIHPAILDACLQVVEAACASDEAGLADRGPLVPVAVGRLRLAEAPGSSLYSHVRLAADGEPGRIAADVTVTDDDGRLVLAVEGLVAMPLDGLGASPDVGQWMYELDWQAIAPLPDAGPAEPGERWLILADDQGVAARLATALETAGAASIQVRHASAAGRPGTAGHRLDPADRAAWSQVLADVAKAGPLTGIVHLWSLDTPEPAVLTAAELAAAQSLSCTSLMHLVQALATTGAKPGRLVVVTAGAQAPGAMQASADALSDACEGDLELGRALQATAWGMVRAIGMEQPDLGCVLVDLGSVGDPAESAALYREVRAGRGEDQVALRGAARYAARLIPAGSVDGTGPAELDMVPVPASEPVMLANPTLGILDNLQWIPARRRPPGPGQAEIAVCAVGLNFRDIFVALGINVGQPAGRFDPGVECAGRVVAVGEGVTGVEVGDEVLACVHHCFASYVTVQACLLVPKPPEWSFAEAATIPAAYGTAYFALVRQARLSAGESVLIHAAAGGVGLAAVRIALALGAEIYATAGSPDKRELLRSAGVAHVMDSRSLAFGRQIMELTGGRGVDVVLNSLTGTAMETSLDVLASAGRFVDIGQRDLHEPNRRIGLRHFRKSRSFMGVNLAIWVEERPQEGGAMFRDAVSFVRDRGLGPLPLRRYRPDEVGDAFRFMAQARHVGKLAVELAGHTVPVTPRAAAVTGFRAGASYLITGGLGGLGLAVAAWMADNGADHLVLAGRSDPSAAAARQIAAIRARGANVVVAAADVADQEQVRGLLAMIASDLPPLRGVIHAAMVLDDGLAAQLTEQRLLAVLAPKVAGAWHLHRATAHLTAQPLDFFVLFSSVAGLLGSPGQASYCAANTFLDALAQLRRSQGLPALSIDWGAWAQVGQAATRAGRGQRLAARGLAGMSPELGLEALSRVLAGERAQVAVVPFDYQRWCQFYPAARGAPIFAALPRRDDAGNAPGPATAAGQTIRTAPPEHRRPLIENYLSDRGAKILGFAGGDLDVHRSLQRLGLDSLMAVELRNAIEADLQVTIPVVSLLQEISIAKLAVLIDTEVIASGGVVGGTGGTGAADGPAPVSQVVDHLSDQEVDDLLKHLAAFADSARAEGEDGR